MSDKEAVEAVAQAIADVKLFLRVNVGGSDSVDGYPVEICRYGDEGEDEIVVIARFDASSYENDLLSHFVREHRARAAIAAARHFILEEAAKCLEGIADAMEEKAEASRAQSEPFDPATSDERDAAVTAFEFRRAAAAIRAAKEGTDV